MGQKQNFEKQKIYSKIRFKVAAVDVSLDFKDDKIVSSHIIYYDGLTKDRMFRTISNLEKAYILLDLPLKKAL